MKFCENPSFNTNIFFLKICLFCRFVLILSFNNLLNKEMEVSIDLKKRYTIYECNQKAPVFIFEGLEIDLNELFEE